MKRKFKIALDHYSNKLKALLQKDSFDLLFYSNRHNTVYRIPVTKDFEVSDLLHILRNIFNLPEPMQFSGGVQVSLSYSIVHNDKQVSLNKTLEQAGIDKNSIITFWLTIKYSQDGREAKSTDMQMITMETMRRALNPVHYALEDYKTEISRRFENADNFL